MESRKRQGRRVDMQERGIDGKNLTASVLLVGAKDGGRCMRGSRREKWKREGTSPIGDDVEDRRRQFGSSAVVFQDISPSQWFFRVLRGVV
jgi:hypothetical protein